MSYLLTIAIPTYNRADELSENLDRWIAQIEKRKARLPIQIVIGDNSTDRMTADLVDARYRAKGYLKYFSNGQNVGYGNNINRCLLAADGTFVWLVGDNDIPLEDSIEKVTWLLDENRDVDFFALDNRFINAETKAVVSPKTFFKISGILDGARFLSEHGNVYAIGGIGTNLYRTAEIQKVVRQVGGRTTVHQTTVLTGTLLADGRRVCVPPGVFYCDTQYEKSYSCREKFELGVQSHVRSMLIVEDCAGRRVFNRGAHRRAFMRRIAGLACMYIVGNKAFDLRRLEIDELGRFDPLLGLSLRTLGLAYRIDHRTLRSFMRAAFSVSGKSFAAFEERVKKDLIGSMRDHYQNKYLARESWASGLGAAVSIVVPCRNEEGHIARFLDSVLASTYPAKLLEILIVDGASTDRTKEILNEYARRDPRIKILDNPRRIIPVSLNIGIRAARGDIIMRMDAHSEYPPDYIRACLTLLDSTGAANAGGRVVTVPNGAGPWAKAIARVTSSRFGVGNSAFRTSETPGFVDTVPFGTFHRPIFDEVGFFNERLRRNQDNEFNARLRRAGYAIAFDPRIRVIYHNQATLQGLCRQSFNTGIWNVYTLFLHPNTFAWRRFVPGAVVFCLLVSLPASAWLPARLRAAFLLLIFAYAGVSGIVSARLGASAVERLRILATFFAYHSSYGIGTLSGVVNLMTGRWRRDLGTEGAPTST